MTASFESFNGVDLFSLESRKKRDIVVEKIDYDYIQNCRDLDELKGILSLLRSGKEGRYPELEVYTENCILALLPARERERIKQIRMGVSESETLQEKDSLAAWSEEMQTRYSKLERLSTIQSQRHCKAPVRGIQSPTTIVNDANDAKYKMSYRDRSAISGLDFRAWEAYDAAKALKKIDEEDANRQSQSDKQLLSQKKAREKQLNALSQQIDLDELHIQEKEVYANYEKQKGNDCFKSGENELALRYYDRSISYCNTNPIVYANRAITCLRMGKFSEAETDCTRAIELDKSYVKAWMRRGMARYNRGRYADAVDDFNEVLRLDPGSREVEKLLAKTKSKWFDVDGRAEADWNSVRAKKSEHTSECTSQSYTSSKKAYKRFEILESDE